MAASLITFINVLGWTLLHSLWQALLIFIILRLLLALLKNAAAGIKYNLCNLALGGIFIWFLFTFYKQWHIQQEQATFITASAVSATAPPVFTSFPASGNTFSNPFSIGGIMPWLDGLYAIGLLIFMAKMLRDFIALLQIRNSRKQPFDPAWENYLLKLSKEWRLSKKMGLYLSPKIDVPVVIGHLKPVIYLPFSMVNNLTPEQIEAILLHELAHIKRYDFLINILQTIVETILFFNPFVWWISKTIRNERENCCDELVLSAVRPRLYAEALLALEENRIYKGRLVLAAKNEKQQLFHRIKNIMEMKTKKLNVVQKLMVMAILAGSIFTIAWLPATHTSKDHSKKKEDNSSVEKIPFSKNNPVVILKKDTTEPDTECLAPPPAPVNPPDTSHFPPPPPPPPATAVPPPPPADSFVVNMQKQFQQFYNSDEWKKYQQALKEYTNNLKQYYNSDEWKKYQEDIKAYTQKIKDYFNSDEWKAQQKALKEQMEKIKERFNSDEWKQHLDSIRQTAMANVQIRDSLLTQVRQQMTLARQNVLLAQQNHNASTVLLSNNGHTVNPRQIAAMMKSDGLLKDKKNYSIKINDNGLYINGKKQDQQYFEKYHHIIGEHNQVEIKKDGDNIQASIHSNN